MAETMRITLAERKKVKVPMRRGEAPPGLSPGISYVRLNETAIYGPYATGCEGGGLCLQVPMQQTRMGNVVKVAMQPLNLFHVHFSGDYQLEWSMPDVLLPGVFDSFEAYDLMPVGEDEVSLYVRSGVLNGHAVIEHGAGNLFSGLVAEELGDLSFYYVLRPGDCSYWHHASIQDVGAEFNNWYIWEECVTEKVYIDKGEAPLDTTQMNQWDASGFNLFLRGLCLGHSSGDELASMLVYNRTRHFELYKGLPREGDPPGCVTPIWWESTHRDESFGCEPYNHPGFSSFGPEWMTYQPSGPFRPPQFTGADWHVVALRLNQNNTLSRLLIDGEAVSPPFVQADSSSGYVDDHPVPTMHPKASQLTIGPAGGRIYGATTYAEIEIEGRAHSDAEMLSKSRELAAKYGLPCA